MDFDIALEKVSGQANKPLHVGIFLFICLSKFIPTILIGTSIIFTGWEPKYYCNSSSNVAYNSEPSGNLTMQYNELFINNKSTDMYSMMNEEGKCYLIELHNTTHTDTNIIHSTLKVRCSSWIYISESYNTIVTEWDLICDKSFLVEISQSIYQGGCLMGEIFLSFLVDKYGRKTIHLLSHCVICAIGVIHAFSANYAMFAVSKAALGMFTAVNFTSGNMLSFEMLSARRRTIPGVGSQVVALMAMLIVPFVAMHVSDWRHFSLVTTSISAIFVLVGLFVPDSAQWLYSIGRYGESEKVLRQFAKWNGVQVSPNIKLVTPIKVHIQIEKENNGNFVSHALHITKTEGKKFEDFAHNVCDAHYISKCNNESQTRSDCEESLSAKRLFTNSTLRKLMALTSFIWFTTCSVAGGLVLSTPNLGGNRHVNFFVMYLLDIPFVIVTSFTCLKYGRRCILIVTQLLCGVFAGAAILIPSSTGEINTFWLKMFVIIIAKCFSTASTSIRILYSKELFPTQLCATANGFCQVWGRIGFMTSTVASYMMKKGLTKTPFAYFAILSLTSSIATYMLPETKHDDLIQVTKL